jgi:hypothetical protein
MLALRKWRAFRYRNCARSQSADVSKGSRRCFTKVDSFDTGLWSRAARATDLINTFASRGSSLDPHDANNREVTHGPRPEQKSSRLPDFLILESGKLTRNARCMLLKTVATSRATGRVGDFPSRWAAKSKPVSQWPFLSQRRHPRFRRSRSSIVRTTSSTAAASKSS